MLLYQITKKRNKSHVYVQYNLILPIFEPNFFFQVIILFFCKYNYISNRSSFCEIKSGQRIGSYSKQAIVDGSIKSKEI